MERVPSLLLERMKHNMQFFLLNYVLVTGILFALSVISSPSAIVGLLCLGGGWVGVVRATSSGSVTIKGKDEWGCVYVCFFGCRRPIVAILLFCVILSFLDETTQLLVPPRTAPPFVPGIVASTPTVTETQLFPNVWVCVYIGITISQKQATIGMGLFSIVALLWLLSHIFWMALGTSGFLCGIHCLLRDASMHKDESDRVVMQGDLTLDEESSFLNSSGAGGGANLA